MRFLNLLINYPYHCGESKAKHNRKWKRASVASGAIMKTGKKIIIKIGYKDNWPKSQTKCILCYYV